ncbi:MAG: transglutaminase domain-containing protein [bacterium]|nr:transglutaminase domain-containing protein [bacterium]
MKKIVALILFLIFLFIPQSAFAEANFTTDYNVTYNVLENALTHVTFDVALTNQTSQYYASSYSIQVGFKDIENILARDPGGKITPTVTKNDDGNSIAITFNEKAVGLNKKLSFAISFDTKDIAQKSGKIWDINIPGLAKQIEYNSFNVKVIVPKFLGNPSYIKPYIGEYNGTNLNFTKSELGESGISISFGQEEIYKFDLLYHLKNPNLFPIKTEIALPPSTNYQDVEISDINPRPQNVIEDKDGNWLAQYVLTPSKKLDIKVTGKAKILLRPKKQILSKNQLKEYLKEQPYWQTSNSKIKKLAFELKTPYAIYQYIVKNLTYDFGRVETEKPRIGALEVLRNPKSAVCLEFTDLFVALARAAGIPAREVNGFAYTQNEKERPLSLVKDVLHAWPEYYDSELQTWIMIDPTWGNTTGGVDYFYTLDFDHFTFAIKGNNSTYPIPAGGYKISDVNTRDINIEFGENFDNPIQTLSFSESFLKSYFSGTGIQGDILVKNVGNVMSDPQTVMVNTSFLSPTKQRIDFGRIPPFGYVTIPVSFNQPSLLTNKSDTVKIAINENYISKEIRISPFILNQWTIAGGILFVSIAIGLSIIIYKSRNLPIFKRKG